MGSRGNPGMSRGVQRALGYLGDVGHSPEAVKCRRCDTYLEFGTDTLGRTVQSCRCGAKLLSQTPAEADAAVEAQAKAAAVAVVGMKRTTKGPFTKLYPPQRCARRKCEEEFTPKSGSQRYCSSRCNDQARFEEGRKG